MKELIKILQNYKFVKKDFFLIIIARILISSIALYMPFIIKDIYTITEIKGDINDLYYLIGILSILTITLITLILLSNIISIRLWLDLYVKKNILYRANILKKDFKTTLDIGTGKLLTRLESGVFSETEIFTKVINILTEVIFMGSAVIIIMTIVFPPFIYVIAASIIFIWISIFFLKKYIKKYYKLEQKGWEEDGRNKVRIIMEAFTIKLYGKQQYELFKTKKNLLNTAGYGAKADIANELFYKIVEFIVRFGEVFILLVVGSIIITTGEYSVSYLAMLNYYMVLLWYPMEEAISHINAINKNWEKYKKLRKFINIPNSIINGKEKYIYKKGEIEFKNIDFGYSKNKKNLENMNLKFLAGKKNALVGHSGGGKSTITKLILRLYDINSGKLLLDGQDIKTLDINTFYKRIGYLPQEPAVFDGTIKENMEYALSESELELETYLKPVSTEKDLLIWEALKKARIDDMVKELKHGLNTEVGEKGIKLSGGEKQRLAIARIFLKNPDIIILDEPTSALDSISEEKITKSLAELTRGKTSIIIAHRLQTVMNADKIIVIENGKVESEGKHEELIKKSKIYKNLVDLQNGNMLE